MGPHGESDQKDERYDEQHGDVGPLPGLLLVLPRLLQLLGPPPHERARVRHVALYVVELLPLRLHQRCHVQEYLVQLHQVLLYLLHRVVPLLDLRYRVHYLPPPLLLYRLLQEALALPARYHVLDRLVVRRLSGHREVPPPHRLLVLRVHPSPEALEVVHQVLELFPQAAHDGGARPVGGGAGAAPRDAALGGVGFLEGLELAFYEADAAEDLGDVGVHLGAEVFHGLGVVDGFALLVGFLEALVEHLHVEHVLFDALDVLEEFVQVDPLRTGGGGGGAAGLEVVHLGLGLYVLVFLEGVRE